MPELRPAWQEEISDRACGALLCLPHVPSVIQGLVGPQYGSLQTEAKVAVDLGHDLLFQLGLKSKRFRYTSTSTSVDDAGADGWAPGLAELPDRGSGECAIGSFTTRSCLRQYLRKMLYEPGNGGSALLYARQTLFIVNPFFNHEAIWSLQLTKYAYGSMSISGTRGLIFMRFTPPSLAPVCSRRAQTKVAPEHTRPAAVKSGMQQSRL